MTTAHSAIHKVKYEKIISHIQRAITDKVFSEVPVLP
jgi:hypothetical protein